jgi:L-fuculose-phosphate aldolase
MASPSLSVEREQIVSAARYLAEEAGVLSHTGHGNMSVRVPGTPDQMLLTAVARLTRVSAENLALVRFDGTVLDGHLDPTAAEIVAMHAVVYEHKPDVQAVIHTHSPRASTFALAQQPLPCQYEALLRLGVTEDIPVAPWGPRGSDESVRYIAQTIQAHPQIMAVLLANHGLLAFGPDGMVAAALVSVMEEAADMTLGAAALGGAKPFPEGALEAVRQRLRQFPGSLPTLSRRLAGRDSA